MQHLPTAEEYRPEDIFLREAAQALCRKSKRDPVAKFADYILSSFEVECHINRPIGSGSSGQVYIGHWNGVVSTPSTS